jgi:hypothetical protein
MLGLAACAAPAQDDGPRWIDGAPTLTSVGALAFGPDGVLFVGDAEGACIVAIDTGTPGAGPSSDAAPDLDVEDLTAHLAQLTGTTADEIRVHDLAVDLRSGQAYLSVTRGGGSESQALLVRVGGPDAIEVLDLAGTRHMRLDLSDAPAAGGSGRRNQRALSVTDLGFHDSLLYVAGLSNEEFASKLRVFPFPFVSEGDGAGRGTNVEVYHGKHGAWETRSPIRTFLAMEIGGQPHLLAGYTCTPLVTFPVEALAPNAKLRGKTVAELGNRNTPLDMVLYEKEGAQFLLIANTARGVMKVSTAGLAEQEPITSQVEETAGLTYETIDALQDVTQLAALDGRRALVLVESGGAASLRTIPLP